MDRHRSSANSKRANQLAPHVLVVDDEPFVRNAFQLYLETHGYRVSAAEDGEQAIGLVKTLDEDLDVVLLDLVMPGIHGLDVLSHIKEFNPAIEVIIATGCGGVHSAIEAMRCGAFDYLTKPIVNFEKDLLSVVRGAVASRAQKRTSSDAALPAPSANETNETPPRQTAGDLHDDLGRLAQAALGEPVGQSLAALLEAVIAKHFAADNALLLRKTDDDSPVETLAAWGAPCSSADHGVEEVASARLWQALSGTRGSWSTVHLSPSALSAVHTPPSGRPHPEGNVQALALDLKAGENDTAPWRLVCLRGCESGNDTPSKPALALLSVVLSYALQRNPVASASAVAD